MFLSKKLSREDVRKSLFAFSRVTASAPKLAYEYVCLLKRISKFESYGRCETLRGNKVFENPYSLNFFFQTPKSELDRIEREELRHTVTAKYNGIGKLLDLKIKLYDVSGKNMKGEQESVMRQTILDQLVQPNHDGKPSIDLNLLSKQICEAVNDARKRVHFLKYKEFAKWYKEPYVTVEDIDFRDKMKITTTSSIGKSVLYDGPYDEDIEYQHLQGPSNNQEKHEMDDHENFHEYNGNENKDGIQLDNDIEKSHGEHLEDGQSFSNEMPLHSHQDSSEKLMNLEGSANTDLEHDDDINMIDQRKKTLERKYTLNHMLESEDIEDSDAELLDDEDDYESQMETNNRYNEFEKYDHDNEYVSEFDNELEEEEEEDEDVSYEEIESGISFFDHDPHHFEVYDQNRLKYDQLIQGYWETKGRDIGLRPEDIDFQKDPDRSTIPPHIYDEPVLNSVWNKFEKWEEKQKEDKASGMDVQYTSFSEMLESPDSAHYMTRESVITDIRDVVLLMKLLKGDISNEEQLRDELKEIKEQKQEYYNAQKSLEENSGLTFDFPKVILPLGHEAQEEKIYRENLEKMANTPVKDNKNE